MKKSKKAFYIRIFSGFMAFYLTLMLLVTYVVQNDYRKNYLYNKENVDRYSSASSIKSYMNSMDTDQIKTAFYKFQDLKFYYDLTSSKNHLSEGFETYAVFNGNHQQIAKFSNLISYSNTSLQRNNSSGSNFNYEYIILDDYMSYKQLKELAQCVSFIYQQKRQQYDKIFELDDADRKERVKKYTEYKLDIKTITKEDETLLEEFSITSNEWEKQDLDSDYSDYTFLSSKEIYHWYNDKLESDYDEFSSSLSLNAEIDISMPYLNYGLDEWVEWMDSEQQTKVNRLLVDTNAEYLDIYHYANTGFALSNDDKFLTPPKGHFKVSLYTAAPIYLGYDKNNPYELYILTTYHTFYPYLYALDNLKYVYLFSFLFGILCAFILAFQLSRLHEKQLLLEKSRRHFTQAMAHELKTPMGIIRNYSEGLKEKIAEEKREHYLNSIIEETQHLDSLVLTMLDLSKMDSDHFKLNLEEVSLKKLVNDMIDKYWLILTEKDINITLHYESDTIILADKGRMEQVLDNLISNALAYSPMHESILINLTDQSFSIENTGITIPEDKLRHIWDMFYRVDEQRDREHYHMGLGLYLVKRILEMHGMKYKVYNTGNGVRFEISYS
ncbi:MAG: histidine kinase [Herbinix sp.]|jgi:signal transduction histidine kinase|nr:histidine kinase [Herbinix sp.]